MRQRQFAVEHSTVSGVLASSNLIVGKRRKFIATLSPRPEKSATGLDSD